MLNTIAVGSHGRSMLGRILLGSPGDTYSVPRSVSPGGDRRDHR